MSKPSRLLPCTRRSAAGARARLAAVAVGVTVALALFVVARTASANGGGLAGYTGKPNAAAPAGESCNKCHQGGTAPQVSITGPTTLTAGQAAEYALVVSTGQARAAAGIAATNGVVLTPVSGLTASFDELTQSSSLAVSGGQATFRFRVTAPASGGAIKLWAVGLACNGSGTGGDRAAHVTRDITVTGGSSGSSSGSSGSSGSSEAGTGGSSGGSSTSSGGAGTGGTSGTSAGASSSGSSSASAPDDGDDDDDADPGAASRRRLAGGEGASCAHAPRAPGVGAPVHLVLAAAIAALVRARRRRHHR